MSGYPNDPELRRAVAAGADSALEQKMLIQPPPRAQLPPHRLVPVRVAAKLWKAVEGQAFSESQSI